MANQQLLDYIKQQLQQGSTKEQITNSLTANGWPMERINSAFSSLNSPISANPPTFNNEYIQPVKRKRSATRTLIFAIVIIAVLLIGGGVFAYFYFWQSPETVVNRMFLSLAKVKSLEYSGQAKVEATTGQTGNYTLDFAGKTDTNDPNNTKSALSLTATINMSEQPMVFGADAISINKVTYVELNKADNFPLFDLSSIENQWIKFDPEAITKQFGLQNIETQIQAAQQKDQLTTDQIKKLELMFAQAKIYKITQTLPSETISGQNTYHYKFIIDIAAIKTAYNEASKIIQNRPLNQDETAAFDNYAKLIDQPQGEIWIGKQDLLPYKFNLAVTVKATDQNPNSGTISLTALFKNYNQPIQIEAPAEYKTIEEILSSIFNSTVPAGTENNSLLPVPGNPQGSQELPTLK